MGLGGNLYAASYPMPDRFDFGTSPPGAFALSECRPDFESRDHGSYKRAVEAVFHHHLRQVAAKDWRQQLKFDRKSERSNHRVKPARAQTTPAPTSVPVGTPTSVPDGGVTLAMLGGTLCGLALLRRSARA